MDHKKNQKNGFTLIEILAAVTILGILSIVSISAVNKVIDKSKTKHYSSAENQMKAAGQEYVQDNRSNLPKGIGEKKKIPLSELIDKKYIKPIEDYRHKKCDVDKSYIQVYKYGQNKYSYIANLVCDDHDTNIEHTAKPKITITSPSKLSLAFEIEDTSDKNEIISYNYTISKGIEELNNSGNIQVPEYSRNNKIRKEINISKYTPGIIKLTVKATNIYGNTTTKTYVDKTTADDRKAPECSIDSADINKKDWIIGQRTITVGCKDGYGESGCSREKFTKIFTTSGDYGNIIIADNEGNQQKCKVSVFIDNTPPEKPVWTHNSSNGKWSNKDIKLTVKSSDKDSGLAKIVYSYDKKEEFTDWDNAIGSDGTVTGTWVAERDKIVYARAYDKVGNVSEWSEGTPVKIDKTAPVINSVTNSSNSNWTNKDVTITLKISDNLSQLKEAYYGYSNNSINNTDWNTKTDNEVVGIWSAERENDIYVMIEDKAGNKSEIKTAGQIKIDKTVPTVSYNLGGGTYNQKKSVTIKVDDVRFDRMEIQVHYNDNVIVNETITDKTFTTNLDSTGTYTVYTRVYDVAGNKNNKQPENEYGWYYQTYQINLYTCNGIGGTLKKTDEGQYICVKKATYSEYEEKYMGTCQTDNKRVSAGYKCGDEMCCSYGWYCATGWDGAGCYENGKEYDCEQTRTVTGYTCGDWNDYTGSDENKTCYKNAKTQN